MKRTVAASLIVVISLALMVACAGCTSSTSPSPSPSPSATTAAAGSATAATDAAAALSGNASKATNLTAVKGQNFAIQLPSNSSIGNGNHWALTSYDTSSITLVNQTSVAGSMSVPGASGADVFTFQGTRTGTSVITFNCVSPTNQIENTVPFTINCTTLNVPTVNAAYISHGQDFTIRLPSNPSTGYHWDLTFYDSSTLKLVNQTFISNASTSSPVVGAGGTDLFTFQATQVGSGGIAFSEISPANQTTSAVVYSVVIAS